MTSRILFLLIVQVCTSVALIAQTDTRKDETLFGDGEVRYGAFAGPVLKVGQVGDELGMFVGGRGGIVINKTLAIGIGGYGLVNQIQARGFMPDTNVRMGYGGLEIEYLFDAPSVLHGSAMVLVGMGGAGFFRHHGGWGSQNDYRSGSMFFVVEPAVNAEINISTWMRVALGVGYRLVSGSNMDRFSNSDLSGANGVLTFKFGIY